MEQTSIITEKEKKQSPQRCKEKEASLPGDIIVFLHYKLEALRYIYGTHFSALLNTQFNKPKDP